MTNTDIELGGGSLSDNDSEEQSLPPEKASKLETGQQYKTRQQRWEDVVSQREQSGRLVPDLPEAYKDPIPPNCIMENPVTVSYERDPGGLLTRTYDQQTIDGILKANSWKWIDPFTRKSSENTEVTFAPNDELSKNIEAYIIKQEQVESVDNKGSNNNGLVAIPLCRRHSV